MSRNLFVFAADTHLAAGAWVDRPTLRGDAYRSLAQLVDWCLQAQLPLVLGGDVYDAKRPPPEAVRWMHAQLDRMAAAQLPVYYIQGQHELDRQAPWLGAHHWPQWLDRQLVPINGRIVYGLDWRPRGQLQEQLAAIPREAEILIAHQVWSNFMGVDGTEGDLAEVPHVSLVLTGDFHKTVFTTVPRTAGPPLTVVSPGSICMQEKSEPASKCGVLVQEDAHGQWCCSQLPLATRAVHDVVINELRDVQSLADLVAQDDPRFPALLRVKYRATLPDIYAAIAAAGAPVDRLFLDPVAEPLTEVVVDFAQHGQEAFASLPAAVRTLAGGQTALADAAVRILTADSAEAELQALFTEYLATESQHDTAVAD